MFNHLFEIHLLALVLCSMQSPKVYITVERTHIWLDDLASVGWFETITTLTLHLVTASFVQEAVAAVAFNVLEGEKFAIVIVHAQIVAILGGESSLSELSDFQIAIIRATTVLVNHFRLIMFGI